MKKRTGSNKIYGGIVCLLAVMLLLSACGKKQPTGAEGSDRTEQSEVSRSDGAGDVSAAEDVMNGDAASGGADAEADSAATGQEGAGGGSAQTAQDEQAGAGNGSGQGTGTGAAGGGQDAGTGGQDGGQAEAGEFADAQEREAGAVWNGQNAENGNAASGGADEGAGSAAGEAPYGVHGKLSVSGTQLVDTYGAPYQLRGVSTHGLAWFPQYVNQAAFRTMRDEWGVNVVRLAMYTAENGGYCVGDENNRNRMKQLVYDGVDAATELGMYVIVDWHVLNDRDPSIYTDQAIAFFRETAGRYAAQENVIYEICNEPNGGVSWQTVKKYAEQVIPVIREQDADAVIIVGTPTWSQDVDQAAANPITGYENIMYALHFYADTHRDSLRQKMVNAIGAGLPVFVSEFGICDASGNGAVNVAEADRWVSAMDENGVSYCIWNLSNKAETSALLRSSTTATSGWSYNDLSDSGKWFVDRMGADHAAIGSSGSGASSNGGNGSSGNGASSSGGSGSGGNGASSNGGNGGNGTSSSGGNGSGGSGAPSSGGNGSSGSGATSNGGNANSGSGTAQSVTSDASGSLHASVSLSNAWETDGKHYYQYSLELTNASGANVNGWTCEISFDRNISVSQSWCGSFSASGSSLTITPESYNAAVGAGASQGNIGFILETDASLTVTGVSCR
ncbi:MAG: cellulase family glycosylhydrolase [bacterium]|nr:cellulase family glycosylhydrolase [bacterium]